ncbi:MAG: hypothetical protein II370_01515 [Clostridia bacterium]|nr:hypothetical protein [Clostridia bacterium]
MRATEFMKAVLPEGESRCRVKKNQWGGLDRSRTFDSGGISEARNIDTSFLPALRSAPAPKTVSAACGTPLGAFAGDGYVFTVYAAEGRIFAKRITENGETVSVLSENGADLRERCIVPFNRYTTPLDPLSGDYESLLLIFPDKKCCSADVGAQIAFKDISDAPMPDIKYATVHLSRVFGVDGDRIYASAFNDCGDYELDTASDIGASNAWATTSQSDTRASGGFSAVACCDGYAVCFRRDFMQQVYNSKNPFRIVDIGTWGCLDNFSHCNWNSTLAFASDSGIWLYSGGYPRLISEKLDIRDYTGTRLAANGDQLYAYVPSENRIFTYENTGNSWGEREIGNVAMLRDNGRDVYAIKNDGSVWLVDRGEYGEFCVETDFMSLGIQNPKSLKGVAATAELGEDSELTVSILYENGELRAVSSTSPGIQVLRTAVRTRRGDFAKIRLSGHGRVDMFGISVSFAYEDTAGGM